LKLQIIRIKQTVGMVTNLIMFLNRVNIVIGVVIGLTFLSGHIASNNHIYVLRIFLL